MAAWPHGCSEVRRHKKGCPISHQRPAVISARFLSELERIKIADLLHAGRSIRAIATELGRSPSTVSREIRRNIHEPPPGNYRPRTAQRSAERRRSRQRTGRSPPTQCCSSSCGNTCNSAGVPVRSATAWAPFSLDNRKCTLSRRPSTKPCTGAEA